MTIRLVLLAVLAFTLSCGENDEKLSQVLLVVQGGEQVRAETTRLEIALKSGPVGARESWKTLAPEVFEEVRWPASLALVPANDGVETGFEVVITAYRDDTKLVMGRVISQFVARRTLLLEVPLEDGCLNFFSCGDAETCSVSTGEPRCETASVDPKELPTYEGPGKIRDNTDPGETGDGDAGRDAGADAGHDAGPCVPRGAEDCFNGQDDDCNGDADCADAACTVSGMCVPGDDTAGVLVGADQDCPEGFRAEALPLHKGLTGGGCTGCSCSAAPTTCSASIFVYVQTNDDQDDCSLDVYNQGGTMRTVDVLFNNWNDTSDRTCPSPIQDGFIEGWRTMAITPVDGACTAAGTAVAETAKWTDSAKLCRPEAVGRGCGAHQVCLPRPVAEQKRLCGVVDGASSCTGEATDWYEAFEDDRSCGSCRCDDGAGGNCADVKVQFGNDWGCNVNNGSTAANEKHCGYGYSPPAFLVGTPTPKTCIANASSSGSLRPTGKTTLCCSAP